jgi:hypothetical protein
MLNSLRLLMFAGAIILGVYQYNQNPNNPDISPDINPKPPVVTPDGLEIIIDSEVESFPRRPSDELVEALKPITGIVTNPDDALRFARAFKHWSKIISQDSYIKDLTDYAEVRAGALRALILADPMSKSYKGEIDPIIKAAQDKLLADLKSDDGVKTEVTPEVRKSLVELNEALSYTFAEIWLVESLKTSDTEGK